MKNEFLILLAVGALSFSGARPAQADPPMNTPKTMNTTDPNPTPLTEIADLGGGCFWCVESF